MNCIQNLGLPYPAQKVHISQPEKPHPLLNSKFSFCCSNQDIFRFGKITTPIPRNEITLHVVHYHYALFDCHCHWMLYLMNVICLQHSAVLYFPVSSWMHLLPLVFTVPAVLGTCLAPMNVGKANFLFFLSCWNIRKDIWSCLGFLKCCETGCLTSLLRITSVSWSSNGNPTF